MTSPLPDADRLQHLDITPHGYVQCFELRESRRRPPALVRPYVWPPADLLPLEPYAPDWAGPPVPDPVGEDPAAPAVGRVASADVGTWTFGADETMCDQPAYHPKHLAWRTGEVERASHHDSQRRQPAIVAWLIGQVRKMVG